jgi:LytS/YehU family sensor histidine kinase
MLESMRYEERLSVRVDIPTEARATRIPVMLLQTVVENAIKHGIAQLPSGGVLGIRGSLRDGALLLEVTNPKPVTRSRPSQSGIGLKNSSERLRLLFGVGGQLEIDLADPHAAVVRIRIPETPEADCRRPSEAYSPAGGL